MSEPTYTQQQFNLMTIDKPEANPKRRANPIVPHLRQLLPQASDRDLFMAAGKLLNDLGADLAIQGIQHFIALPHVVAYFQKGLIRPVALIPRITQAAAADQPAREPVEIRLELSRRRARNEQIEQAAVQFYQQVHTAHPIMRRYIKRAVEDLMKAAFRLHPEDGPQWAEQAILQLRGDQAWLSQTQRLGRVPKDTTAKLIQIMSHLARQGEQP